MFKTLLLSFFLLFDYGEIGLAGVQSGGRGNRMQELSKLRETTQ